MEENKLRRTPLYEKHIAHGGKLVPFAGYELPVQYIGVIAEHVAVRQKAGLFDASHTAKLQIAGPDATGNLQHLLTGDIADMSVGEARYSLMCNDAGGIVDDLVAYKLAEDSYLLAANAANRERDAAWIGDHLSGRARLVDCSDRVAEIAIHGPAAEKIIAKLAAPVEIPAQCHTFGRDVEVAGIGTLLSRSDDTGEEGFELFVRNHDAENLWDALLDAGAEFGLVPAGLGAHDTLRFETGAPACGRELTDDVTPFEAGLGFAVQMDKGDFVGKHALAKRSVPARRLVGLRVSGPGVARGNCDVLAETGSVIGRTTSGVHCPYLGASYAMALLAASHTSPGTVVEVEARGGRIAAEVVPLPFYRPGIASPAG